MGERDTCTPPDTRSMPLRLVIAICCAIFLIVDVLWLASEYPRNSRVGHAVAGVLGWEKRPTGTHPWVDVWIESTPDGLHISTGASPLSNADTRTPFATFTLWPPLPPSGFWAPTQRELVRGTFYSNTGRFNNTGNLNIQSIPPTELQEPIRDFIASTHPLHLETYDELIATGGTGTRPRWTGYLHNAVSALAATALLICVGALALDLVLHLRDTRFPSEHCCGCGYDLSGLAVGSACPECGSGRRLKGE